MTPAQVERVQDSYSFIFAVGTPFILSFYDKLFAIDPALRPLFRTELSAQSEKLLMALTYVVKNLHDADRLLPVAEVIARRHVGYGVKREDYLKVGQALIEALDDTLDMHFTPETHHAWLAAYTLLAGIMCDAAYGSPAEEHMQQH
ncbi:globin domain-containing protein [Rhizobium sp. CECT 9324]|jgi:hemoglobin-like flavoprotein|uniref:globin domain-containing protein n=1 Tax=Rhizobium sp. CECT 9324 TaxID=2845820 RepID=UPI001E391EBA|nr:globin domain-containing protein [Rhizobium sp. CECT 9324]CAH0343340.1 Flavohemoprotein [Rhizobium sp. CECT 9324]